MTQFSAYLSFNGNCREAMTFYKECMGGELNLQTVAESPMAGQMPAHLNESILHSTLTSNVAVIMGSDMVREKLVDGNTVQLCINCSSQEEIESLFSNFSSGGKIIDPLKEMFWGGVFGAITDKYGKHWLFNYEKNKQ
ncbi:MAG: hypothetical protein JWM28_4310 [Chitinophagaceae bacterium]|nr:hypothetical protein [Chitinophagaceae bacterium]